jgi:hypothetical protein
MYDLEEIIKGRRSIRKFLPNLVPKSNAYSCHVASKGRYLMELIVLSLSMTNTAIRFSPA